MVVRVRRDAAAAAAPAGEEAETKASESSIRVIAGEEAGTGPGGDRTTGGGGNGVRAVEVTCYPGNVIPRPPARPPIAMLPPRPPALSGPGHPAHSLWSKGGQMVFKWWSNGGQMVVKWRSNGGQMVVASAPPARALRGWPPCALVHRFIRARGFCIRLAVSECVWPSISLFARSSFRIGTFTYPVCTEVVSVRPSLPGHCRPAFVLV